MRIDVRLENETVWLTQGQLCELFGVVKSNVSYHLKNIFCTGELDYEATVQKIRTVRIEAGRRVLRDLEYFNLDVIISLGYRINSRLGIQFRQWATRVLKEFMLRGYAFNQRLNQLEDKVDRRMSKTEADVVELKEKGNISISTIPLTPMRDMVEIRGSYEEITRKSFYENTNYTEDYVHITLTDEEDIVDAIGKLRVIYRNLMKLDYDNQRTRSASHVDGAEDVESKSPLQHFASLYELQNNQSMSDEQKSFVEALIEQIWGGEV